MPTYHATTTEEELILSIITHPCLDPRCWKMVADAEATTEALGKALETFFPAETKACRTIAAYKWQSFWQAAADFVARGLFRDMSVYYDQPAATIKPRKQIPRPSHIPLLSGGALGGTPGGIHMPGEVYDYLLMSHTS